MTATVVSADKSDHCAAPGCYCDKLRYLISQRHRQMRPADWAVTGDIAAGKHYAQTNLLTDCIAINLISDWPARQIVSRSPSRQRRCRAMSRDPPPWPTHAQIPNVSKEYSTTLKVPSSTFFSHIYGCSQSSDDRRHRTMLQNTVRHPNAAVLVLFRCNNHC